MAARRRPPAQPIVITPGDPDGIGPEVVWKALRASAYRKPGGRPLLCVGAVAPFRKLRASIELADPSAFDRPPRSGKPVVWILPAPERTPIEQPKLFLPGYQAGWSIETATRLVLAKRAAALVTGPISKERLQRGGYKYPGHTEFLAKLCGDRPVTMMLTNEQLRVSLVTTHVALGKVPAALSAEKIERAVLQTLDALKDWWGIRKPRIAVLGLNPHAGECGLFGDEEQRLIGPTVVALRRRLAKQATIDGPAPADTLFAKHILAKVRDRYDAVICMYHDQGLIPVKLLDFRKTVNVTLGLPIVRTSVDHGVGFDIAGKGIADPSSLKSAIDLAIQFAGNLRGI